MASAKSSRTFSSYVCQSCRQRFLSCKLRRTFTSTSLASADSPPSSSSSNDGAMTALAQLGANIRDRNSRHGRNLPPNQRPISLKDLDGEDNAEGLLSFEAAGNLNASKEEKPYRLHVYATKHNTHITLVQPPKPASQTMSSGISGTSGSAADKKKMVDVLLSLSTGNIGFRKAGRGSYDAAYQLAAFALKQIQEKSMLRNAYKLEVVLRGFGAGREAVTKALLGSEGRNVRGRISAVVDATRLKLGGPRSPKPRRLG